MRFHDTHLADEDLVLAIDRELPAARQADVDEHLDRCHACRTRYLQLEEAAADLAALYPPNNDRHGPAAAVTRAALQSRLRDEAGQWEQSWRVRVASAFAAARQWAPPGAAVAAAVLLAGALYSLGGDRSARTMITGAIEPDALPMASLTPGATVDVTAAQICAAGRVEERPEDRTIPAAMRQEVLRAYGMEAVPADEYELDYLITPELGGATNARNLWPQRYAARTWNAYVKDQLEDLLPQMVCTRQLDLQTAQHDIAVDWIAAYKKYFRTRDPLTRQTRASATEDGTAEARN